jgi:hypothetical protein
MAREVEADVTPEIFERAFRKVAFGQLAQRQAKRRGKLT